MYSNLILTSLGSWAIIRFFYNHSFRLNLRGQIVYSSCVFVHDTLWSVSASASAGSRTVCVTGLLLQDMI